MTTAMKTSNKFSASKFIYLLATYVVLYVNALDGGFSLTECLMPRDESWRVTDYETPSKRKAGQFSFRIFFDWNILGFFQIRLNMHNLHSWYYFSFACFQIKPETIYTSGITKPTVSLKFHKIKSFWQKLLRIRHYFRYICILRIKLVILNTIYEAPALPIVCNQILLFWKWQMPGIIIQ